MRLLSTKERRTCCIGEVEVLRSKAVESRDNTRPSIPAEHGCLYDARPGPRTWGCGLGIFVWQCIVHERLPYITLVCVLTNVCACS